MRRQKQPQVRSEGTQPVRGTSAALPWRMEPARQMAEDRMTRSLVHQAQESAFHPEDNEKPPTDSECGGEGRAPRGLSFCFPVVLLAVRMEAGGQQGSW